jgi:hypothetical protein
MQEVLSAHTAAPSRFSPTASGAGTWIGNDRTLTGFAPGQTVAMQVVVWDMRSGSTYENAALRAASRVFTYTVPLDPLAPPAAYFMEGFGGFNGLSFVPEPWVTGLALVGAGALFMLRRATLHRLKGNRLWADGRSALISIWTARFDYLRRA